MPRLAGPNIIKMGETWKAQWLQGKPIIQIANQENKNSQIISRAIWLAGWPKELKDLVFTHPAHFTRTVLMNEFAAKRGQCEKEGFKLLKSEMKRIIQQGKGTKPTLNNTNKNSILKNKNSLKTAKKNSSVEPKTNPIFFLDKSREAEFRIKEALSLQACVSFNEKGAGEVRVFFDNDKDLNFIIERLEDVRYGELKKNPLDLEFWSTLEN